MNPASCEKTEPYLKAKQSLKHIHVVTDVVERGVNARFQWTHNY